MSKAKQKSEIQSIKFQRYIYDTTKAKKWLEKNNHKPIFKVKVTPTELTYVIQNSRKYKRFFQTKSSRGIIFIFGFKTKNPISKSEIQS